MIRVPLTIRSDDVTRPPYETEGFVPDADCPLAAHLYAVWDEADSKWHDGVQWQITHRRTGFSLGKGTFRDRDEAIAVLMRCEPSFPAWQAVQAGVVDAAMLACRYKFRAAIQE